MRARLITYQINTTSILYGPCDTGQVISDIQLKFTKYIAAKIWHFGNDRKIFQNASVS